MKSVLTIINEHINNFYLIVRLSIYELKSTNNNNYLGILWEVLNPMIQISVFWFVFGLGIRGDKGVGDIAYLPWMLSGISVWFFISQSILQGSRSIYSRVRIIAKMKFPMSVIPTFVIASKYYSHLILTGIIMVILFFYDYSISVYFLQLPYFMAATIAILIAISLITATLATIVRDVQMVVQSVVRVLLYLTPILWTVEKLPEFIQLIMKLNPFYYIVEGYRSSLLGLNWYFIDNLTYTLYFWGVVFILLLIGSVLHVKFRDRFVDFL
ncbi:MULTISPECIES: ABC transporter permease [Bacillaceae]|uniref:ABC transporter permease n=1 Tax=Bacillaceae TaxID=186817 RepID=UPI002A0F2D15|nr:ABC transporter permease [Cytobacillus sp. IB215316]MDX8360262.1 ABC transporter permease [Cytobacillus sp. IB215316]